MEIDSASLYTISIMFRPRPNAAGGSSKDAGQGDAASASADITGTPATADGVINESQASLPGIGEESLISRMMADKYVLHPCVWAILTSSPYFSAGAGLMVCRHTRYMETN
jgi:hypothetical protein